MASILLLYGIGTLAVPVTMVQYSVKIDPSSAPLECDGCKWLVGKAQDYLKKNEPRLDNITESALDSNICSHLPPKDADLCKELVSKYIPVALDSLVEKISDPAFICTEVVPLCFSTEAFRISENRVRTPVTIDACSKSFRLLYDYLENNTKNDITNMVFTHCKRDNSDKVLTCEVISQHVSDTAISVFNDDVDICNSYVFTPVSKHPSGSRRILEMVNTESDIEDNDDDDEETDYEDDSNQELNDVNDNDGDEEDEDEEDDEEYDNDEDEDEDEDEPTDKPDIENQENQEDHLDDDDIDSDSEDIYDDLTESDSVNGGNGRRLLRFRIKISNPFKRKSSPPPPPKPAPAPKPAPKAVPAPVPKAAPAPAPKAAPKPAPKAVPAPSPPTVVPSLTPAPKPTVVSIKSVSTSSSSSSKNKKKGGFLKKGISFIKKAVPVVAKTAVNVVKATSPVVMPAVSLIPGSTVPLTLINKVAPKIVDTVKKVAPKVKKVISKIKEYKSKSSKSSKSGIKLSSVVSSVKSELPKLKIKVKDATSKLKPLVSTVSSIKKELPKLKLKVNDKIKGMKIDNSNEKKKNVTTIVKNLKPKIKNAIKKVGTKLKSAMPKIKGIKIYGNYCGPNYCGGEKFKGAEGPNCRWGVSPKDSLDGCCKLHDQCCGTESSRGKQCNKEILECAKKATCSGANCTLAKAAITAAFTVGKNKVCGDFLRKSKPEKTLVTVPNPKSKSSVDKKSSSSKPRKQPVVGKKPIAETTARVSQSKSSSVSKLSPSSRSVGKNDNDDRTDSSDTTGAPDTTVKQTIPSLTPSVSESASASTTSDETTSETSRTRIIPDTTPSDSDSSSTSSLSSSSSISKEIADSIPETTTKLTKFRERLVSIVNELTVKDKALETENQGNYEKVEKDVEMEQLRIEANRKILSDLNDQITTLNATIQRHYKTLIEESTYIKRLDAIRPGFLKSLEELSSHIDSVKTVVDSNIVKDEYKDEMISLLNGVSFNARNISGFVATAFINHYNKYKAMFKQYDADYDESILKLSKLSAEYKEKQVKMVELQRERSRLESILLKLKNTLSVSKKTQKEFDDVLKEILSLFDKKAKSELNNRC